MQQNTLTERIKTLRTELKLSQTEFGKRLGKNYHSVMRWELGKVLPPMNVMEHICDTFGVNMQWLMTGGGNMLKTAGANAMSEKEQTGYTAEESCTASLSAALNKIWDRGASQTTLSENIIATEAPADSASPVMPGDIIFYAPTVYTNEIPDGKLCMIKNNYDENMIRWVHGNVLVSKRPEYPDTEMTGCEIVGVIKQIFRKILF